MMNRIFCWSAAAVLTVCGAAAADAPAAKTEKKAAAAAPAMPPPAVLVEKVVLQSEGIEKKYVGWLEAIESVSLPSRVSGVLQKRLFKEGEAVRKGDLLFEIEDTTYVAQVRLAQSQVKQLEAELVFARNNYNRQKNLKDGNKTDYIVHYAVLFLSEIPSHDNANDKKASQTDNLAAYGPGDIRQSLLFLLGKARVLHLGIVYGFLRMI